MKNFFSTVDKITYKGSSSSNKFSFKYYNPDETINNKRMEDHLRFAACYWHNFVWPGTDPFGGDTFERPWFGNTIKHAKLKADIAFEMFSILNIPYFCFHDHDVRPEGTGFKENTSNLNEMVDYFQLKMEECKVKLLWGTANLFSHKRYMAGAATNPDPEIFAFAAATVKSCIDATHQLKGENYVLWGGREGYETLLNTDIKSEINQLGTFLNLVVDYKHKIGFKGTILIEPKPQEPTKHQYDYDVGNVFGFLKKYGLENEVKVNIETGHAFLANHSFEHEIALACALGIFGSIDMNRNDVQSGWDTDQFPNNYLDVALAYYHILLNGGFKSGGTNFDAKLRRQSLDPEDLLLAHIGAMDTCALGFKSALKLLKNGDLKEFIDKRYSNWSKTFGKSLMNREMNLEQITRWVEDNNINPEPVSGKQEYLENIFIQNAITK